MLHRSSLQTQRTDLLTWVLGQDVALITDGRFSGGSHTALLRVRFRV